MAAMRGLIGANNCSCVQSSALLSTSVASGAQRMYNRCFLHEKVGYQALGVLGPLESKSTCLLQGCCKEEAPGAMEAAVSGLK